MRETAPPTDITAYTSLLEATGHVVEDIRQDPRDPAVWHVTYRNIPTNLHDNPPIPAD